MYHLYLNGTFNFIHKTYSDDNLWKTRDCRVRCTPPTETSYKYYAKCLKKILSLVLMFPKKTLERELLYFVAKQLSFFIFPPVRIRRNHHKHITKRAKKFQDGKWEDLWKQALHEYDLEITDIQSLREKSTLQKVSQSKHFHRFGTISRA